MAGASLCCLGELLAQEALPGEEMAETQAQGEGELKCILQKMGETHSDDFYEAAACVLGASGDELAFVRAMQEQADKGSSVALYWLGMRKLRMIEEGDAALSQARQMLLKAAESGYAPAQIDAAWLSYIGIGGEKDEKKAMELLMAACKQGDYRARAVYLALTGRLASGNYELPEIASELRKGNYYLEELIARGQENPTEVEHWLRLADGHGSAYAPYVLTQLPLELTKEESWECLKRSAERHHTEAIALLGNLYVRAGQLNMGEGDLQIAEDARKGLKMMSLAAALGDPVASQRCALFYAQGEGSGDGSANRICELFRYASLCGDPDGMAGLGYCMVAGKGCPQDVEAGLELMEKGRLKGSVWVNQAMASLYFNGHGVKADLRKALDLLIEDASSGSIHAYTLMAALTALGNESAKPDPRTAGIYMEMAQQRGEQDCQVLYDAIVTSRNWQFMPILFK